MTYVVVPFSIHDPIYGEFDSLAEARREAARILGVAELDETMRGGCPDDESNELIGVECWLAAKTDNEAADAEGAIYILCSRSA